jgi:hypothetical protein
MINYKLLLKKYMTMISKLEGTDYTETFNLDSAFWGEEDPEVDITKEEAIELIKLSNDGF